MGALLFFAVFSFLIVIATTMVVISRDAIASASFLVLDMFLMAGLYAFLDAHFVATIQVLVYAGAIMILFLFVIMLLNLEPSKKLLKFTPFEAVTFIVTLIGFFVIMGKLIGKEPLPLIEAAPSANLSNTHELGMELFTKFLWPFELASILILLAVVAAVIIAKKEKTHPDQRGY